ncbi:hypothetical protein FP2506_11657 [Fulvimarina pelagi HTCC2506]|uniref:DUF2336 domain-containing protein n=1 Tax=Fulvimarina pelagi HTCC2506 TaxID=314231 RepID=Q0FYU8_9HYPH|nr:hypothetical protein [Fulvimarina pelagi]EAU40210.1 hypothetical protein FP2506_11657 [Fulvimarina pelagi HTCC2506]
MRSQLPDLYRSLEKGGSAKGYDAIAMAASLNFIAIPIPSQRQSDAFAHLLEPLWSHLARDTRIHLAAQLSEHHMLPKSVADLIGGDKASETCDQDDETSSPEAADTPSPISIRDLEVLADRRTPCMDPTRTATSAADARATLRALVARPAAARPAPRPIIQIAQSRDRIALCAHLADNLELSRSEAEALLDPDNLPDLAMALKALGLGTSDAMTVLMFIDQTVASDMAVFAIAKNHYKRLTPEAAAAHFGQDARQSMPTPSLQPTSADLLTPIRSTGRRRSEFGRRGDNQNRRAGTRT